MSLPLPLTITQTKLDVLRLFENHKQGRTLASILIDLTTHKEKDKWRKRVYQAGSDRSIITDKSGSETLYMLSKDSENILINIDKIAIKQGQKGGVKSKPAAKVQPIEAPIILSRNSNSVVDQIAAMSNENSALITFLLKTRNEINNRLESMGVEIN